MADAFLDPDGMEVELAGYSNSISKCGGCEVDRQLCQEVNLRLKRLIAALGPYARRLEGDSHGTPVVRAREIREAKYQPGVIEAADDFDEAEQALTENRSKCSGSEEFHRDGERMVYCPQTEQEFPKP